MKAPRTSWSEREAAVIVARCLDQELVPDDCRDRTRALRDENGDREALETLVGELD